MINRQLRVEFTVEEVLQKLQKVFYMYILERKEI